LKAAREEVAAAFECYPSISSSTAACDVPPAPPVLYKYYPPERVDIFQNWSIRFSHPARFNDLFDCDLKPHDQRSRAARLKNSYTVGVFSLTEDPDSPVMWGHYAASHTGFVLGLKTDIPPFSDDVGPQKVEYQPAFSPMPFTGDPPLDLYRVKSSQWEYESEWRCIRRLRWTQSRDLDLPVEAIAEIIVGSRISSTALNPILQVVDGLKPDFDIPVNGSKPDLTNRTLIHQPTLYELCVECSGIGHLRRKATGA
jgi:hypothetical protein